MRSGISRSIAWQSQEKTKEIGYSIYSSCLKARRQVLFNSKNNKRLPSHLRARARKEYESICDQHEGLRPFDPRISKTHQEVAKKNGLDQSLVRRINKQFALTGNFLFPGNKGFIPSPYQVSLWDGRKAKRTPKVSLRSQKIEVRQSSVLLCNNADNAESSNANRVNPSRGCAHGALTGYGESLLPKPSEDDDEPLYSRNLVDTDDSDCPDEDYKVPPSQGRKTYRRYNNLVHLTPDGVVIYLALARYLQGFSTWERTVMTARQILGHAEGEQKNALQMLTDYDLLERERKKSAETARLSTLRVYRNKRNYKQEIREAMNKDYESMGLLERLDRIKGTSSTE